MNIPSTSNSSSASSLFHLAHEKNLAPLFVEGSSSSEFINTTIATFVTTTLTTTATSNRLLRFFNASRLYALPRLVPPSPTTISTSLLNKYFLFKSSFNRNMRIAELSILSLTLPLYAIVFTLFIELTAQRVSKNTAVSGGNSRSRTQRRRQRMRSLIWTSNYLLVDFLGLLYELVYVIIHLTGDLALNSLAGRFYCQVQVYLPLYLTVLMAYSLTAISVYRRRHFVALHGQTAQSTRRSLFLILALWIMPIVTSIMPAYLLTHLNILRITQHELTNECQITYTYGSTVAAIYMCYRLGNIFLLPLSISFACYLTICVDLIRMQRRFTRAFDRHVHIRKNLILQILFLFLNFAVFWLPAEIITLYAKSRLLKDTVQVTKSFNILLDPLIITGFDTRFSSAAQHFLSKWRLDEFMCFFGPTRQNLSTTTSSQLMTVRSGATLKRPKQPSVKSSTQPMSSATWNIADDQDITVLESTSNHVSMAPHKRPRTVTQADIRRKQQQKQRRRREQLAQVGQPPPGPSAIQQKPRTKRPANHLVAKPI